jgi:hypothetical protein
MFDYIMKPVELLGALIEGVLVWVTDNLPEIKFL